MDSQECPHVDVNMNPENLNSDFNFQVLQVIRPEWKSNEVVYEKSPKEVSRGLINTMVKCYHTSSPHDAIMIRVYNNKMDQVIDRSVEATCIKKMKPMGCAPNILATFKNGFCYQFIDGVILNHRQLEQDPIWRLVAEEMAKMHSCKIVDGNKLNGETQFWQKLDMWLSSYPDSLSDPEKNHRMKTELPSKEILFNEANLLKGIILEMNCPVVLCHNDTRAENIIWNAETSTLKFVDFEAMEYGYQASEIASHFTKFAGMPSPDLSLIPSEEFQMKWINAYLRKYYELTGKNLNNDAIDKDVRKLYVIVQKFYLFLMIAAGIAGPVIEAKTLLNIDLDQIDFILFAVTHVNEYFKRKEQILQLKLPD